MAVHDRMGVVRARIVPGTHVVTADTATTTATHPARTLMTPARMTPIVNGSSRIVKPVPATVAFEGSPIHAPRSAEPPVDSGPRFRDDIVDMNASRSGLGACCATTPSSMCFWTAVFLLAYGAALILRATWPTLGPYENTLLLSALAVACFVNFGRNPTTAC